MKKVRNLDRLPGDVQRPFELFVSAMIKIHTGRLQSVAVYGSAAGRDYHPGRSDVNSVFLFDQVDMGVLENSQKLVAQARKHRISAPLFLTRHYIEAALDIFPLEFLEMKEHHVLIYGDDVFSSLEIRLEHLHLFCEQQIKGKLIRIRQAYLELGQNEDGLVLLMEETFNSLLPVFRGLIRLKGKQPPTSKEDVLNIIAREYDLSTGVLSAVYRELYRHRKPGIKVVTGWLGGIIDEIRKLAVKVGQLKSKWA
jgi:hypothetical protein